MINNILKTITFFAVLVLTMNTVDGLIIDKTEVANSKKSSFTVMSFTADLGGGTGSAVAINETGRLITNYHVIDNTILIKVFDAKGNTYLANIVKTDKNLDLAEIQIIQDVTTVPVTFGKDSVFGDQLYAIGAALGVPMQLSYGMSSGELNLRSLGLRTASDVRIEHGNSGGGLFNSKGELVGLNTNVAANRDPVAIWDGKTLTKSETLVESNGQGIALSIPVSVIKRFLGVN